MTVRTQHHALRDFVHDRLKAVSAAHQVAHVVNFRRGVDVVEVKDYRVALAAVLAGVLQQVRIQPGPPHRVGPSVLLVQQIGPAPAVCVGIGSLTGFAGGLEPVFMGGMPMKLRGVFEVSARCASFGLHYTYRIPITRTGATEFGCGSRI